MPQELTDADAAEFLRAWGYRLARTEGEEAASEVMHTIAAKLERGAVSWTTERPTVPGWYWWRNVPGKWQDAVRLYIATDGPHAGNLVVESRQDYVTDDPPQQTNYGEWAGPIPEPVEVTTYDPECGKGHKPVFPPSSGS